MKSTEPEVSAEVSDQILLLPCSCFLFFLFIHLLNFGKVGYTIPVYRKEIAFRIKTKC